MSPLTDHERTLPPGVIARCADTDSAHCTPTTETTWYAVLCSPPTETVYGMTRPCVSKEHGIQVLVGLPEHYLPAYVATRKGDGQWVPAGPERGCAA